MTCRKHPSWGRTLISLELSSYEIIFIELGTIRKISLVEWRRFYFHQQIHVHVTGHIISCRFASYHVIFCHISHMFSKFHLVWRAYWFLLLWSGVMHTSCGKYAWIHVPVRRSKRFGPLLGVNIFLTNQGEEIKYFSGISLSYLAMAHN